MTIRKRAEGGIEVTCDFEGCQESYVQETSGPAPEGWTRVEPLDAADPLEYCPLHAQPGQPER